MVMLLLVNTGGFSRPRPGWPYPPWTDERRFTQIDPITRTSAFEKSLTSTPRT